MNPPPAIQLAPDPAWSRICARVERMSLWRLAAILFLIAFSVRIALVLGAHTYLSPGVSETVNVARALASKGQFADAYRVNSGPTAHSLPLYPLLLSLIYRVFPVGPAAFFAQAVLGIFFACILYALLPLASRRFGMGVAVGALAGMAGALLPLNFWTEDKGVYETTLSTLLLLLILMAQPHLRLGHSISDGGTETAAGCPRWWGTAAEFSSEVLRRITLAPALPGPL